MLLCRPGMRLSAAASVHTSGSAAWLLARVGAQTHGDVTLTLRKGTTFQGYRLLRAAAGDSARGSSGNAAQLPGGRDSPPAAGLSDWAHWSRSLALDHPSTALLGQPLLSTDRRRSVLLSANLGLFTQRSFAGTRTGTGTMQSRSASTSGKEAHEPDNATKEVI